MLRRVCGWGKSSVWTEGDCVVINVKCKHKPPVTVIVSQLNDLSWYQDYLSYYTARTPAALVKWRLNKVEKYWTVDTTGSREKGQNKDMDLCREGLNQLEENFLTFLSSCAGDLLKYFEV